MNNYSIAVCDSLHCELAEIKNNNADTIISEVSFQKPYNQIILQNKCTDTLLQNNTRIYGIELENDSAGVLYHMIGVNGAEYRHYNLSVYFLQQLKYLREDLTIISLGTNESFNKNFK